MIMKYINEINIKNKKVLIRVDYNIPIEDGKILNRDVTDSFSLIEHTARTFLANVNLILSCL